MLSSATRKVSGQEAARFLLNDVLAANLLDFGAAIEGSAGNGGVDGASVFVVRARASGSAAEGISRFVNIVVDEIVVGARGTVGGVSEGVDCAEVEKPVPLKGAEESKGVTGMRISNSFEGQRCWVTRLV